MKDLSLTIQKSRPMLKYFYRQTDGLKTICPQNIDAGAKLFVKKEENMREIERMLVTSLSHKPLINPFPHNDTF